MSAFKFHTLLGKCEMALKRLQGPCSIKTLSEYLPSIEEIAELRELAPGFEDDDGYFARVIEDISFRRDIFDLDYKYLSFLDIENGEVPQAMHEFIRTTLDIRDSAIAWIIDPESEPYRLARRVEMNSRKLCFLDGLRKAREFNLKAEKWREFCHRVLEAKI